MVFSIEYTRMLSVWMFMVILSFFFFHSLQMNADVLDDYSRCYLQSQGCSRKCIKEGRSLTSQFYLIRSCSRSKMNIVAKANLSLQRCVSLAQRKRAFAINIAPIYISHSNLNETCQILACPEFESLLSLERNINYDYYSIYADPLPPNAYKCIPGVGLFRVESSLRSWRSSRLACLDEDSDLAQVTSPPQMLAVQKMLEEERSKALSQHMKIYERTWVGMQRSDRFAPFFTITGQMLTCYRYRAWAPQEPRRDQKNCVGMNSTRWYTLQCNDRYPSICELRANGPSLASGPGHWDFPSGRCPAQRIPKL